jgi:hypothetical protein
MGFKDFARSLRPGNDHQLAAQMRAKQGAAERRAQAEQADAVKAISDRDKNRTPAEVADSRARGRRSKRGPFEPPARGVNP